MLLQFENPQNNLGLEAVNTECFLQSRLGIKSCEKTCIFYELIYEKLPNIEFWKVFDNETFVYNP